MDLLFKRYASPFVLLDRVIGSGQFCDFLDVLDEQKKEEEMWEFYIHKLPSWDGRTYQEFKDGIGTGRKQEIEVPSDEQLETTISDSYDIMMNFKLEQEEERG